LFVCFERENGLKGRLSLQTNPAYYRDADAITQQAIHFDSLAPNIQVKAPVTKAGVTAIEEMTYHGVNINATVCFCVPQALAVAEAVERGLNRRSAEGKDISKMSPVCTIIIGRLDDWIKVLEKRDNILLTPGYSDWAGIAAMKKAYAIYHERGYRTLHLPNRKGGKVSTLSLAVRTSWALEQILDGRQEGPLLLGRDGQRMKVAAAKPLTSQTMPPPIPTMKNERSTSSASIDP
jgi:transaldolase